MKAGTEITITEVARKAGVSITTVSRILNNRPDVAPETRKRVERVIQELGYAPNAQAISLRVGKTSTISMLYPFDQPESGVELGFIIGAMNSAGEEGYFFNIMNNPVDEGNLLRLFRSGQLDGVILEQVHMNDWRVNMLEKNGLPFVMIGRTKDPRNLSYVDIDLENCVYEAFAYLAGLGHRKIGFLLYPQKEAEFIDEADYGPYIRAMFGYERALAAFHLEKHYRSVRFSVEELAAGTAGLIKEEPRLTAFVIADGARAVGVINTLFELGYGVPNQVSVVGIAPESTARLVAPPLTTIDFPSRKMGYEAVKMLIRRLQGETTEPEQVLFGPKLIVRKTTRFLKDHA